MIFEQLHLCKVFRNGGFELAITLAPGKALSDAQNRNLVFFVKRYSNNFG